MTDWLRLLRGWMVNILGITVPGLLLLIFFVFGFVVPVGGVFLNVGQQLLTPGQLPCLTTLAGVWTANKTLAAILGLILGYIAGCILRLSTPDDLDKKSAELVLRKMDGEAKLTAGEAAKRDHWPFRLEDGDKFPYYHFKEYLVSRGLDELAELVTWGPPNRRETGKRSKTHVNLMKLDVLTKCPELSAVLESNEAHVRLMFGTWLAITTCWKPVTVGVALSTFEVFASLRLPVFGICFDAPLCGACVLSGLMLLLAMHWARSRIENLFHYQRVRELTQIVACAHYAQAMKVTNKPDPGEQSGGTP